MGGLVSAYIAALGKSLIADITLIRFLSRVTTLMGLCRWKCQPSATM